MTDLANIGQSSIAVEVDYYNDRERKKLLTYPTAARIAQIVAQRVLIPTPEFLTYYLFHRGRPGKPGYRDYSEISRKIGTALSDLQDFIEFNGQSICKPRDANSQIPHITEYIGESIGLSVVGRIHSLTEADWGKIPETRGRGAYPTFDYEIVASDGKDIVQVETKGSSVRDNRSTNPPIYAHYKNIVEKKTNIAKREKGGTYPHKASIRYGTIAAVDSRIDGLVKCWIADPEPLVPGFDPYRLRLLNRLRFFRDWISFVSPRSNLAASLSTRIVDLISSTNLNELDGVPLQNSVGEPFEYPPVDYYDHSSFSSGRSHVRDGPVGGVVLQISKSTLFFLGVREEIITQAASQQFAEIIEYKAPVTTTLKTVECKISEGRFRRFSLPPRLSDSAARSGGYVRFPLEGQLNYAQEGIVFGMLPLHW